MSLRHLLRPLCLLLPLLLQACAANSPVVASKTAPRVVTDGKVDIGGLALHIHCVGQGAPTVVLEAGLGNDGSVWRSVQGEIGRLTRTCVYDRAGLGYSDGPAPKPHTHRGMARELHQLLTRSGLQGPYVLVGHSMGGINVRLFEAEHPDQVVGLVLVDATTDPLAYWSLLPARELEQFREMLPQVGEGLDFHSFVAGAADMQASSRSLGAKPLVILTRSIEDQQPWASAEQTAGMLRVWQGQQSGLLKLSSNAVQVVVPNSHHYIQLEAPKVVVGAIEEVVRAARSQGRVSESGVLGKLDRGPPPRSGPAPRTE